jgi:hypothetical protein
MIECGNIQFIADEEYIGDSLTKINTNFQELTGIACDVKQLLDSRVNIRTFFYYGPNVASLPIPVLSETAGDGSDTRPSNDTIERFVNSADGLNLTAASELGDYAWVIYQKTGWFNVNQVKSQTQSGTLYFQIRVRRIGIGYIGTRTVARSWSVSQSITDTYNLYAPAFVIYKLRYIETNNGPLYKMVSPEPQKPNPVYTRSTTASTDAWNTPRLWDIYNV